MKKMLGTCAVAALMSTTVFANESHVQPVVAGVVADAAENELEIEPAQAPASAQDGSGAAKPAPVISAEAAQFCFFPGSPPSDVKFQTVRKLKVGKGTYGGVKDILPKFANQALGLGADAVMNYAGSQRFGFWPWRMVRPVVQGVAIQWTAPPGKDCAALGGSTLATILATDKAPGQQEQQQ
ncbi:hypothetical protein G7047_07375 [Diaphorobacter sp. HDW4A]|uniref:hypothetical protein n=1 Tax=Diaphorobacter sp. HDW4A TaxID=2714924 RepID=UPI00140B48CF|nr:hypothetical protein [Diaphorobacter sp. HDW4A]QIL79744.1 hypothetical protein G7047_07375 [Diaphorobacter sp. HDW4A]